MLGIVTYVSAIGRNAFLGRLPATPARAMALFEETGVRTVTAGNVPQWESPDVYLLFRDANYDLARAWAERAYQALLRLANRRIGPQATFYLTIGVRTTPYYDGESGTLPVIAFHCAPEKALSPEYDL